MEYVEITPEIRKKYLKDPNTCPFCSSEDITGGHVETDDNYAWREVKCLNNDCKMGWMEIFTMTDIDEASKYE